MLAYNIHELRTQNQKYQSMATWIYLLPSGLSGRGPIASQFHSEKMNEARVCSVIRIVLFPFFSFSFHTGVTCIDKFLYIGSQQFPVICFMLYFRHISLNSFPV